MQNFIQRGETVALTAPYAVASGAGALVGNIFGVAADTVASGVVGQFALTGVIDLAKDTSTFADGDNVYWDNSAKKATSTALANTRIGAAALVQPDATSALGGASGDATVRVRLNGTASPAAGGRFKSTELTGTGSSQNVAHGLGVVPSLVIFYPSDTAPSTLGSYTLTEGVHTSTNLLVTVTSGKKFFAVAFV
jgi:predicted RecA/RadA family phage recombinase